MERDESTGTRMSADSFGQSASSEALIAYLDVIPRDKKTGNFPDIDAEISNVIPIRLNEQFYVGRASDCKWVMSPIWCSNHHFRIYSIMFEKTLPPLVYCEDLSLNGTYLNGKAIGKYNRVLLTENDKLEIRCTAKFEFHTLRSGDYSIPDLRHLEEDSYLYSDRFNITSRLLGHGGYGTVHMAQDKKTTKLKQVACKVLRFDALKGSFTRKILVREVEILMSLNHPNIINLLEVYSNEKRMYVFEDMITGGDLWSYLEVKGRLAETEALPLMWQCVKALIYLHGKGIVHRDLKPDNILLASSSPGRARVVLADFGTARMVNGNNRMTTYVGTIEYTAPEVTRCQDSFHSSGYTLAADLWSFGNVLYTVLRGYPLFAPNGASDRKAVESRAAECDLRSLDTNEWRGLSAEVKDLIRNLLVINPLERLDAIAVKNHRWFSRYRDVLEEGYQRVCSDWQRRSEEVTWVDVSENPRERMITRNVGGKVVEVKVVRKEVVQDRVELENEMEKCSIGSEGEPEFESRLGDVTAHNNDPSPADDEDVDMDDQPNSDEEGGSQLNHQQKSEAQNSYDPENHPSMPSNPSENINLVCISSDEEEVDMEQDEEDASELYDAVSRTQLGWKSAKEFSMQVLRENQRRQMHCSGDDGHGVSGEMEEDIVPCSQTSSRGNGAPVARMYVGCSPLL